MSYNKNRNKTIQKEQNFEDLSPFLIKKWFEEYYKSNSKVKVEVFDETGLLPYPNDQDKWAERFKKQFPDVNYKIADGGYREFNEKYFSGYGFYEIDREKIPVHSTMLRGDISKNIDFLIPTAREYFLKQK